MILRSAEGASFEMHVVGYQFPTEHTALYDSNWLQIRIVVHHPLGNWSREDPALLTYEAQRLSEWLDQVADGSRPAVAKSFLEPNLEFEAAGLQNQSGSIAC